MMPYLRQEIRDWALTFGHKIHPSHLVPYVSSQFFLSSSFLKHLLSLFFFLSNNNEQWPPQTLLNCLESITVKLCYKFSCVIMNYNLFRPGTIFFFCVCTMYSQSFTRTLGNGGDRVNWVDGYWVLATEADKFPKVRSILFQVVPCPITSPFYR